MTPEQKAAANHARNEHLKDIRAAETPEAKRKRCDDRNDKQNKSREQQRERVSM